MFIIVVRGLVMEFPGNSQAFGGNLYCFSATWCRPASAQHLRFVITVIATQQ